jgi:hypothetical protein
MPLRAAFAGGMGRKRAGSRGSHRLEVGLREEERD